MSEARDIYIGRIKRELIGPGSDIFYCSDDFGDEIIEGKPLTRYYSGILFPPKTELVEDDPELFNEDNDELNEEPVEFTTKEEKNIKEENEMLDGYEEDETFKLRTNLYFPTNIGLTFCVPLDKDTIDLRLNFGTYKKASSKKVKIKYNGEGIELLSRFGLQEYIEYDVENKTLALKKELKGNKRRNLKSEDYLILDRCLKKFAKEVSYDHTLLQHIKKLEL